MSKSHTWIPAVMGCLMGLAILIQSCTDSHSTYEPSIDDKYHELERKEEENRKKLKLLENNITW